MSPVVDTHTHWMVASDVFPEMKESGAPPPRHVGKNMVTTQGGVSIIAYEDFYNIEKANAASADAGVTKRLLSASMILENYSRILDLPSLEIAKRINDQGAPLLWSTTLTKS